MRIHHVVALAASCAFATAQGFIHLPVTENLANAEGVNYTVRPLMQADCRAQFLYDAAETGTSTLTIDGLQLRYDGPIPAVGLSGPFTIQRLQILVGATSVATPGATFADNLSQPLVPVFDGPFTYTPDTGSQVPHPWGIGGLDFTFPIPVPIVIPSGGHLVIEMIIDGNVFGGASHTMLDAVRGIGGPVDGQVSNIGYGCSASAGAPAATITTTGVHAPGAAHFAAGTGLGANAPGFLLLGISDQFGAFGSLPVGLPGTNCTLYNSADFALPVGADATGAVIGGPATALVVPPIASLAGAALFEQFITLVPGANAPFDLVMSDQRTVTFGPWNAPSRGTWMISHGMSSTSPVADRVEVLGLAVRLHTL